MKVTMAERNFCSPFYRLYRDDCQKNEHTDATVRKNFLGGWSIA